MIYLDNSSTTRQYDEVTKLIYDIGMEGFGNPSSLHSLGFSAAERLDEARKQVERCLPSGGTVVFTSCGTESDNTALFCSARKMRRRGSRIITTQVEHPAILETCRRLEEDGFEVIRTGVDKDGLMDMDEFRDSLTEDTILVSVMTVNNESGTIEPVLDAYREVSRFNREHGTEILFHTDAVQAFGKMRFDSAPFDMISLSGHKIHGPKGTGALWLRKGLSLPPFVTGGGQESGARSGTENTTGIAGLGLAAEISYTDLESKQRRMDETGKYLLEGLEDQIPDIHVNGPRETGFGMEDAGRRCPSVLNISFEGTRGEVLLHTLEQDGIFVSTGSACASHKTGDSHVLQAMGRDHRQIESAIRFSFSEFNTKEEMDFVIDRMSAAVRRFRKLGSFR